jgi:hypothetical protein
MRRSRRGCGTSSVLQWLEIFSNSRNEFGNGTHPKDEAEAQSSSLFGCTAKRCLWYVLYVGPSVVDVVETAMLVVGKAVDLCASFFPGLKDDLRATLANCVMRDAGVATSRSCGDSGVWYGF